MGRPVSEVYKARNEEIRQAYVEGKSITSLHEEYGLTKTHLRGILEAQGVELRPESRRLQLEQRPRDQALVAIGARLHADRMKRGLTISQYAVMLGISEAHLNQALQGLYNWKFMEMARAAKACGIDVSEFIRPVLATKEV